MTPTRRKGQLTGHQMPVPRSSDCPVWGVLARSHPHHQHLPPFHVIAGTGPCCVPGGRRRNLVAPHPHPTPRLRREVAGPRQTVRASPWQVPLAVGASRGASALSVRPPRCSPRLAGAASCGLRARRAVPEARRVQVCPPAATCWHERCASVSAAGGGCEFQKVTF